MSSFPNVIDQSSIYTQAISTYKANLHYNPQQKTSRLQTYCELIPVTGERTYLPNLEPSAPARRITGRYTPVQFADDNWGRRELLTFTYVSEHGVDSKDVEQMLMDPTGPLVLQAKAELERAKDLVIYQAMFATVNTGVQGETPVTASQDGVITINATAGLTYEKILEIKQNFIDNEVGNDEQIQFCLGISGSEHTSLLEEIEFTSGDYTRQGQPTSTNDGNLQTAVGLELVKFGANVPIPVLQVVGGVRNSFVMAHGAITLGIVKDLEVKVQVRTDLHETTQIIVTSRMGAVRRDGKLIQMVTTTPLGL